MIKQDTFLSLLSTFGDNIAFHNFWKFPTVLDTFVVLQLCAHLISWWQDMLLMLIVKTSSRIVQMFIETIGWIHALVVLRLICVRRSQHSGLKIEVWGILLILGKKRSKMHLK